MRYIKIECNELLKQFQILLNVEESIALSWYFDDEERYLNVELLKYYNDLSISFRISYDELKQSVMSKYKLLELYLKKKIIMLENFP